jgi:hypothetical protein
VLADTNSANVAVAVKNGECVTIEQNASTFIRKRGLRANVEMITDGNDIVGETLCAVHFYSLQG